MVKLNQQTFLDFQNISGNQYMTYMEIRVLFPIKLWKDVPFAYKALSGWWLQYVLLESLSYATVHCQEFFIAQGMLDKMTMYLGFYPCRMCKL